MQFRIASYDDLGGKSSHCGVLEFSAEEGFVYMPQCVMNNLGLNELDLVTVANVVLPKEDYLKLRPHTTEFLNKVKNPKEVLEATFREHSCLTAGDTVVVCYDGERFKVDVVETRPSDAVSVIDTDCNVTLTLTNPWTTRNPKSHNKLMIKTKEKKLCVSSPSLALGEHWMAKSWKQRKQKVAVRDHYQRMAIRIGKKRLRKKMTSFNHLQARNTLWAALEITQD
ncbi:ubiquitin fusion degradation protein 1 homolog [Ipomoea triloba]|uniref:ubiquitin fusion degradation protein 1 homolog n=1 Tax=Ipomoea triloba TaxID=35885 RepID=UPI00125CD949|nr:ubiquitin fusion degradation protein 1 homolog [Ipomoea triloba]